MPDVEYQQKTAKKTTVRFISNSLKSTIPMATNVKPIASF